MEDDEAASAAEQQQQEVGDLFVSRESDIELEVKEPEDDLNFVSLSLFIIKIYD